MGGYVIRICMVVIEFEVILLIVTLLAVDFVGA